MGCVDLLNCSDLRSAYSFSSVCLRYNFAVALQLLGLSDGTEPDRNPVLMRGAYLSFLCLRHLHIRELQVGGDGTPSYTNWRCLIVYHGASLPLMAMFSSFQLFDFECVCVYVCVCVCVICPFQGWCLALSTVELTT